MKAKAANRTFVTSIRSLRAKGLAITPIDPLTKPHPFLVPALRLRQRKADGSV